MVNQLSFRLFVLPLLLIIQTDINAQTTKVLLPTKEQGPWECVYYLLNSNDDLNNIDDIRWTGRCANEDEWIWGHGPFSNSDDQFLHTFWASQVQPLLIRRHFTLSAADIAALDRSTLTVTCSYDENPRFYLNGTSFWSITGWNDNDYLSRTLTSRHKALLKEGDNVLAVSLMQGWGGGHIDYGFTMLTYDDSDAILQVVDDAVEASGMVYNLCGQRVEHPQYGIYIVKGKKIIY